MAPPSLWAPAVRRHPHVGFLRLVLLTVVTLAAALLVVPVGNAAAAGGLPSALQQFAHCPVDNPQVSLCLAASDTGSFVINSTTLTEHAPITLIMGLIANADGTYTSVLPDDGSPAMVAPSMAVPGGLLGTGRSGGELAVRATPQLVGLPVFSINNLLSGNGPTIVLPTDVLLTNQFLGTDCTIGTASDPETLNLTDGATSPPPPNTPITGIPGTLHVKYRGKMIKLIGSELVDNAFAVPGASNCGSNGSFDSAIDALRALPSAAGLNTGILQGSSELAEAQLIRRYVG
jgi:hypothetical protein